MLRLPLLALRDGRPRYVVLSLSPPPGPRSRRTPAARLRLRLQWRVDDALPLGVSGALGLEASVVLSAVHVSVVEAADAQFPREILNVTMQGLALDLYHTTEKVPGRGKVDPSMSRRWHQSCRMRMQSMQVDNQLLSSDRPVVLVRSSHNFMDRLSGQIVHNLDELRSKTAALAAEADLHQPMLQLGWELVQHNSSILYFDYFDLLLQVGCWQGGLLTTV